MPTVSITLPDRATITQASAHTNTHTHTHTHYTFYTCITHIQNMHTSTHTHTS